MITSVTDRQSNIGYTLHKDRYADRHGWSQFHSLKNSFYEIRFLYKQKQSCSYRSDYHTIIQLPFPQRPKHASRPCSTQLRYSHFASQTIIHVAYGEWHCFATVGSIWQHGVHITYTCTFLPPHSYVLGRAQTDALPGPNVCLFVTTANRWDARM